MAGHSEKVTMAALRVAFAGALAASPASASQPIWQPAIYCAALDFVRAEILGGMTGELPAAAGTPKSADLSGRVYRRIAAEALDCPPLRQLDAMISTARIGIVYRIELATQHGLGGEATVLPLASESELVCALHFDPDLMEAARSAETRTPPAPLCEEAE